MGMGDFLLQPACYLLARAKRTKSKSGDGPCLEGCGSIVGSAFEVRS